MDLTLGPHTDTLRTTEQAGTATAHAVRVDTGDRFGIDVTGNSEPEALDTLIAELEADRQEWAGAQEECRRGAEQLCLHIQADADAKIQCISNQSAALQQQVHAPAPNFNTDILYQTLH